LPFPAYLAGQRITAASLAESDLIGRVIFKATRDATFSVSSNVLPQAANALPWETVNLDLLGGWSAVNPTRWTAPVTAWYTLMGSVGFTNLTTGTMRGASWMLNGVAFAAGSARPLTATPTNQVMTADARSLALLISAGSYVELVPVQDTPGALVTSTGGLRPYISILYGGTV
jgi:hypothetical protein